MRDILVFLHVACMMVAFATLPAAGFILHAIAARAETPQQAKATAVAFTPVFGVGGPVVGIGALLGLALAYFDGFLRPWLIATYVVFAVATYIGAVIEAGWVRRLAE